MSAYEQAESGLERMANAKIRRAMEEGEFRNLKGEGKPMAPTDAHKHGLSPSDPNYLAHK
ncbi:hypothetical protein SARC_13139, partial [Sphaeroforma arctica JP610]